ncbi:hypothetical protein ACKKBF_B19470 [Auxenochlorella protothecoides x Auxenochlorella symbiontica]
MVVVTRVTTEELCRPPRTRRSTDVGSVQYLADKDIPARRYGPQVYMLELNSADTFCKSQGFSKAGSVRKTNLDILGLPVSAVRMSPFKVIKARSTDIIVSVECLKTVQKACTADKNGNIGTGNKGKNNFGDYNDGDNNIGSYNKGNSNWGDRNKGTNLRCNDSTGTRKVAASFPQEVAASFPQEVAASFPQEVAASLPQEVAASLPQEVASSLPQEVAASFPQEVAASFPQEVAASFPSEEFTTYTSTLFTSVPRSSTFSFITHCFPHLTFPRSYALSFSTYCSSHLSSPISRALPSTIGTSTLSSSSTNSACPSFVGSLRWARDTNGWLSELSNKACQTCG